MTVRFPTSNSFFVSDAGRRLQKRLRSFLAKEDIKDLPSVLIGPDAPLLQAFEQNRPEIIMEKKRCRTTLRLFLCLPPDQSPPFLWPF